MKTCSRDSYVLPSKIDQEGTSTADAFFAFRCWTICQTKQVFRLMISPIVKVLDGRAASTSSREGPVCDPIFPSFHLFDDIIKWITWYLVPGSWNLVCCMRGYSYIFSIIRWLERLSPVTHPHPPMTLVHRWLDGLGLIAAMLRRGRCVIPDSLANFVSTCSERCSSSLFSQTLVKLLQPE